MRRDSGFERSGLLSLILALWARAAVAPVPLITPRLRFELAYHLKALPILADYQKVLHIASLSVSSTPIIFVVAPLF